MMARWLVLALGLSACGGAQPPSGPAPRSTNAVEKPGALRVETIATGLDHPWGIAQLPDGRWLVSERPGRLRVVAADGRLSPPLGGVPAVVASGQGGLLDVAIDPDFATNGTVYFSYAEPGSGGTAGTAVARGRLGADRIDNVAVIYRQEPKVSGGNHFGSRIVFARDGTLLVTQGDRFSHRDQAQDLESDLGKIVRVNTDGSIPGDNPFTGRGTARPEIWSYGHRNIQAAALDPASGQLWTVEHGAAGGDELNHPEPGKNYGWPVIGFGVNYRTGAAIHGGTHRQGMEQAVHVWVPSIGTSGLLLYTGDRFPRWKGNLFAGGLSGEQLVRLTLEERRVRNVETLAQGMGRIRDVRQGPDGYIYLAIDSRDNRPTPILRLEPAGAR